MLSLYAWKVENCSLEDPHSPAKEKVFVETIKDSTRRSSEFPFKQ